MSFAANLTAAMRARGYSSSGLADALYYRGYRVSDRTVRRLASGDTTRLDPEQVQVIAEILNVDPGDLVFEDHTRFVRRFRRHGLEVA